MNAKTKFLQWTEELMGTVRITALPEDHLGWQDRITALEGVSAFTESFIVDAQKQIRTIYPITNVEIVRKFVSADEELTDIPCEAWRFEEDSTILTFNTDLIEEGNQITVRYKYKPVYHILDVTHEIIQLTSEEDGIRSKQRFPISAMGVKPHYLLKGANAKYRSNDNN